MITPREFKRLNYPQEQAVQHNVAVLANTDILATVLSPIETDYPVIFRAMVAFNAVGVFSARITRAAVTVGEDFNSGGNLVANAAYAFDLLVSQGDTINFRYSANATMLVLRVQEIRLGA